MSETKQIRSVLPFTSGLMSLGNSCKTRYQVERYLKSMNPEHKPSSLFFDWLFLGGLRGVINLLERDLVITADDIVTHQDPRTLRFLPCDQRSGMGFLHDFGTKNTWYQSREECEMTYRAALDEGIRKFAYLRLKTLDFLANKEALGLVYNGAEPHDEFIELRRLLKTKFSKDFLIVRVVEGEYVPEYDDEQAILTVGVQDDLNPLKHTRDSWKGWDDSWGAALSNLNFVVS